jgi:Zn-dependent protease with chaperone function
MDFFGHQDQARKRTKQLIVLFILALLALIFLTNLLVAGFLWGNPDIFPHLGKKTIHDPSLLDIFHYISWQAWLTISGIVCSFVGLAYLYKVVKLSNGGTSIVQSLGGRLLRQNSEDFYEKRLLNIVEEMAIASGMPVPQVFLMDDEIGINAFAAGFQPSDAIIGVTKGCLTKLSRLQLQGVIGHEFSHILNGDMRMNMRLIAILFGILYVGLLGKIILEAGARDSLYSRGRRQSSLFSSSSNKKEGGIPLFLIGLGFMILGYSGVFFGNAIYSNFSNHFGFLSTHPKLEERIRRIDKNWDGE